VRGFDVVLCGVILEVEVDVKAVLKFEVGLRVVVDDNFRVAFDVDVDVRMVLDVKVVLEAHVVQESLLVQGVEKFCGGFVFVTVVQDVVVVLVCGWGGSDGIELEVQGVDVLVGGAVQIESVVYGVVDERGGGGGGTEFELVVHGVDMGGDSNGVVV
jgi:hypothetical protein